MSLTRPIGTALPLAVALGILATPALAGSQAPGLPPACPGRPRSRAETLAGRVGTRADEGVRGSVLVDDDGREGRRSRLGGSRRSDDRERGNDDDDGDG